MNHRKVRQSAALLVLTAPLGYGGCAHYTPKPLEPEETAARFEARTLDDPGLRAFIEKNLGHSLEAWPPARWDLELLTLSAFYYRPALDEARARWQAASAAVTTAGARPNPTLNLIPEYSLNPPAGISPWSPSLGIDLPLETAGKRGHRVTEAQQRAEAARLDVLSTAWRVRSELRSALLDLAAAHERERLLDDRLQAQERITRSLEQQLAVGAVAASDVTPARTQLAKTRLDLETRRADLAQARVRVADALGVPLSAVREVQLDLDLDPANVGDLMSAELRSRALLSRTDVLSALADYAAAQAALQLEIARQYPDVVLGPGYQWDQGQDKWRLGFAVELPLFNRNQGPIAAAEARRAELAAHFLELQGKAISEVDHASTALQLAQQALTSGESLLAEQRQQLESMRSQFAAGAVAQPDVDAAQLALSDVRELNLEARIRRQQALGDLEDAMQWPTAGAAQAQALLRQIESTQQPPAASP